MTVLSELNGRHGHADREVQESVILAVWNMCIPRLTCDLQAERGNQPLSLETIYVFRQP